MLLSLQKFTAKAVTRMKQELQAACRSILYSSIQSKLASLTLLAHDKLDGMKEEKIGLLLEDWCQASFKQICCIKSMLQCRTGPQTSRRTAQWSTTTAPGRA